MPLSYILKRLQSDTGISSPDLNAEQSNLLLDVINEAAEEIYETLDLPYLLREVTVSVTADYRISLPAFVGEIRACRRKKWGYDRPTLKDIIPKYTGSFWGEKWNNIRVVGESPIAAELNNSSPLVVQHPIADSSLTVNLIGETLNSNRAIDSIVLNAVSNNGTLQFEVVNKITRNLTSQYDTIVTDADGNELAVIYADQLESRYIIVDISKYPNIQDCADGTYGMEVLFKPKLPRLVNLTDEFPVDGYDNIILLKAKQLLAEDKPGEEQRAILMHEKVKEKLENKVQNKNGPTHKVMGCIRNPILGLFRRRAWRDTNWRNY